MQLRYETGLTGEQYVTARAWREARLERCPKHPHGGCSLARHGTYERKTPQGVRVARWYCPESHTTFGLLPDCLAARLPGYLTAQLHPGLYRVHYVSLTTGNVLDMYKSIAWEIGIAVERSRSSAHHAIRTEISRLAKEAKQLPVLVVDEAHHLRNDVLEDLRLLTNFAMDSEQRMCLILVGLTELRRRLSMAVHESLSQRLVVRHHLTGLDRDEVDAYLKHRLRLAGCELPLFEAPAVEALFQGARGLPRQINRIAHYALSAAALDKARTVNAEHLQHALDEFRP